MEPNAQRLLDSVKEQLIKFNVPNAAQYESNVVLFLNQCPDDQILADIGEKDLTLKITKKTCEMLVWLYDTKPNEDQIMHWIVEHT